VWKKARHAVDDIGNQIVASIASEIEAVERNRAVLKPPDSLDAWQAYHRGLWHMYRFTHLVAVANSLTNLMFWQLWSTNSDPVTTRKIHGFGTDLLGGA
jgi:hypothetical protein